VDPWPRITLVSALIREVSEEVLADILRLFDLLETPLRTDTVHTFHIPVMATGFTIDTPLKVARFGIASVVSMVDDVLIEQVRQRLCNENDKVFEPIGNYDTDARARRITAYLDLLNELVQSQMERLRNAAFEAGSEIARYFELLPTSPLRNLYERMLGTEDGASRAEMQNSLRAQIKPGPIDVNIMTKLDRDHDRRGQEFPANSSDALSALRGFMNSSVNGSVVLSAGMNRRLFTYMSKFEGMFPNAEGLLKKRITLKVSDYRSALVQGKQMAKLGLHISEFRVESGLNCGGHAFGGKGQLMGPVLAEFQRCKQTLFETLKAMRQKAWATLGLTEQCGEPTPARITAQGGLGSAQEDQLLREHYGVDGTGWGSAFLFVPSVVNIDADSLHRIQAATEQDIDLSPSSPLGVPFWSLLSSASETTRRRRITEGKPGSQCPKGFLAADSEFTNAPICTASRAFQKRKLKQIESESLTGKEKMVQVEAVVAKACICHDLAGGATSAMGIDDAATTSVCCGPNAAYFQKATTLDGIVAHIYGRTNLPLREGRPHMMLKELSLNIDFLRRDIARYKEDLSDRLAKSIQDCRENLENGFEHYRELASSIVAQNREAFVKRLEIIQQEFSEMMASSPLRLEV